MMRKLSTRLRLFLSANNNEIDPTLNRRKSMKSTGSPTTPSNKTKLIRIMLLGAGDSGKSTFFKQVRHIYERDNSRDSSQFTPVGDESFRVAIYFNVMETMQALLRALNDYNRDNPENQLTFKNPENAVFAEKISKLEVTVIHAEAQFTKEVLDMIVALWTEECIKKQFAKRFDYHVFDGAPHFFLNSDLSRLDPATYIPTFEDAIYCRRKTTGVVEAVAKTPYCSFHFVDVGGQRSERKKWKNRWNSVDALIFVVSLSEYDQYMYEDETCRRLDDSMDLFDQTVNNSVFADIPVIIFFNKTDLFKEKLQHKPLSIIFPEYTGGDDFEKAVEYIKQQFLKRNKHDPSRIYCTTTSALSTDNVRDATEMVMSTLIKIRDSKDNKS